MKLYEPEPIDAPRSKLIGTVAVVLISTVLVVAFLSDISTIIEGFKIMHRNITQSKGVPSANKNIKMPKLSYKEQARARFYSKFRK